MIEKLESFNAFYVTLEIFCAQKIKTLNDL